MTDIRQAYKDSLEADAAWSEELTRVYGRQAGDARYDYRGTATTLLATLADRFMRKSEAWRLIFRGRA